MVLFVVKKLIKMVIPEYIKRLIKGRLINNQLNFVTAENAVTFTDKLKYRVKQSKNPMIAKKMALYADKYVVRKYVSERIGDEYLTNVICVTKNLESCDWLSLPKQFVIKTNFGTGSKHLHIVLDKDIECFKTIRRKFLRAMKDDWYLMGQEMFYSYIDRRILIEEYIPGIDGFKSPDDYKIHCFRNDNDNIECIIQIDRGRFECIKRNFYDNEFNLLNINYGNAENFDLLSIPIEVSRMIELSKNLMGDLTYARIDWYLNHGRIIFGEITHIHTAGTAIFSSLDADSFLGDKIKINKIFI